LPAKRSKQSTSHNSILRFKLPAKNIAKPARSDYLVFMVVTKEIEVRTKGNCDIIDITAQVAKAVTESGIAAGTATIFNVGSTAGITTTEYEPGLVKHDIKAAFEKLAPRDGQYEHNKTWDDDNGYAHVRASMLGPSLVVPVVGGKLTLGTWQQIVLIDFDTRPRTRRLICQIIGE
jgi:secondary thiamine-phosphate synthase enzyme